MNDTTTSKGPATNGADDSASEAAAELVNAAVTEGGSFEVIQKRLRTEGDALDALTTALNEARIDEFGSTEMAVLGRTRVRTEHNCVGRDIVQVGGLLVFGYNVFIGLRTQTAIKDVFALYRTSVVDEQISMEAVPIGDSFLDDARFTSDFAELYTYYKNTRLVQLVVRDGKLLAGFQFGDKLSDVRVFRWRLEPGEIDSSTPNVQYIDNRGERDLELPAKHDFEWMETQRDDIVQGRFSHINILDKLFVETTGGTLTIKVENNTEVGEGVFSEPVDEPNQSLNDADIAYSELGELILLRVLPYKEVTARYLVFNTLDSTVRRIDAIGDACVRLPEDHGIIFPDGYYLTSGEYKAFGIEHPGLQFKRRIRSPNGEDVLFVFYEPVHGYFALLSYNLITKSLQNPVLTHGYALTDAGTAVVFTADDEPTRLHPMQLWRTPYTSDEFANQAPVSQSFFSRIGNSELVRGISDLYSVCRMIRVEQVSAAHYATLSRALARLKDDHFWIDDAETGGMPERLAALSESIELIVDEFEKVESIRKHSAKAMRESVVTQTEIVAVAETAQFAAVADYVQLLDRIRQQRGHLATLKEYRYIDVARLSVMDEALVDLNASVGEKTAAFLAEDDAFDSYRKEIETLDAGFTRHETVAALSPDLESLDDIANGLDLLSELIATLKIDDPTVQTAIIDRISDVYALLNGTRARARRHRDSLGSTERVQQFAAQFKLFSQSVTHALGLATSPERSDEQQTRLLVQLEEIEGQFGEYEQFLGDIYDKRDEIHNTFAAHRQQLTDAQQARAQTLVDAVTRMLTNIERRAQRFDAMDALNTYLASDALVLKVRDIVEQLRDLGSTVKADDVEARMKMIKDLALRSLRDKSDLYSDSGRVIQLGDHRFGVNTEELDLTILARGDVLNMHLVGTRYFEPINDPRLDALKPYWQMALPSESVSVYRGEYLAYQVMRAARAGSDGLQWSSLANSVHDDGVIEKTVQKFAATRYREGYQKGVHDSDAVRILRALVPMIEHGDLLRFDPASRSLAQLLWYQIDEPTRLSLTTQAIAARELSDSFNDLLAIEQLEHVLRAQLDAFLSEHAPVADPLMQRRATSYLVRELGEEPFAFVVSKEARRLVDLATAARFRELGVTLNAALTQLDEDPVDQWNLANTWLKALLGSDDGEVSGRYVPEAAILLTSGSQWPRRDVSTTIDVTIEGLLGEHARIEGGKLSIELDSFLNRLDEHDTVVVPSYREYQQLRQAIADEASDALQLDEFKPRPLSSFVRNQLVDQVYLPLIGDNLAKQIGTVGESKRSDLNGLLMMISPPGYGKTTLMEYAASCLGLTFMKINGPALGHDTHSLDPETAPDATARRELNKLNLALEMGDNVMLYVDDIQHTNPEFLQKFISLCDATRRIEGVWKGRTRTYDLRGRKFCVVMAGNPYTESGELFRIPDMLANRADIYNLGDILSGTEQQFELSYIENALSSNAVLAPLATRNLADVYMLVDLAQGREVVTTDLSHAYSGAEINEITRVLQHLFVLRDVVLKVNQQYIASAAQEDRYRTEPRFLLQGSYRNMNKLTEKVSSAMNEGELQQLIDDHYRGEAQLLTQGTEANLLKLASLRGVLSDEQAIRWAAIQADFLRDKATGGDDADAAQRIALQLTDLVNGVSALGKVVEGHTTQVSITNTPSAEFRQVLEHLHGTIQNTLFPLVRSMDKRIAQDIDAHAELKRLVIEVERLKRQLG